LSSPFSCTVSRAALIDALSAAARVVDKKVIPILGTVLLIGEDDGLRWWATDGTIWRSGLVPATQATGSGLVPATQALAVIKACSGSDVRLAADKSYIVVTAGGFTAKLPSLAREDFPTLPVIAATAETCAMASDVLKGMLRHVMPAVLASSLELCGALFRVADRELCCVSTDRHQLARITRPIDRAVMFNDAIVSHRVLQELARMLDAGDSVDFAFTADRQMFRVGDHLLIGLPISAKFPAFERIIPKTSKTRVVGTRAALLAALDRVALASDDPQRHVLFTVKNGAMELSARSPLKGEATESVAVTTTGPSVSFRLNPDYARNYLGESPEEEIACEMLDELRAIVFGATKTPDDIYIVMPMRG
jgi:DNA polymerase-3 subunit beta